jgi:hypothetical protein
VIATVDGASSDALAEAQLVLRAWLAAWGTDEAQLRGEDVRSERTATGPSGGLTRVMVRAAALPRSPRHSLGG